MKVLVLGSEGLIGKSLCNFLKNKYEIIHYDKKIDLDILDNNKFNFLSSKIKESDFIFFLAFDVGGSQYLEKFEHTKQFISNNIQIMENVFNLLELYKKPFIFTSSMMTKIPHSTYGILKSIGERYTKSLNGISVRFWNVYGIEEIEENRNHAITDFIVSAIKNKQIFCKTNGKEVRQFIHADDASCALEMIMKNHEKTINLLKNNENCIDISNGEWTSILNILNIISQKTNSKFFIKKNNNDRVQKNSKIEPNLDIIKKLGWIPRLNINNEIENLIKYYNGVINNE